MKARVSSNGGFLLEQLVSSMREATASHCGLALETEVMILKFYLLSCSSIFTECIRYLKIMISSYDGIAMI